MICSYLDYVDSYVHSQADPRVLIYPFMSSMWPNVVFCFSYLLIVFGGRRFMDSRQPFRVPKLVMILYNGAMIAVNAFMFSELVRFAWLRGHSFRCANVELSTSTESLRLIRVGFLFWFVKIIEFVDTFLFVLRKKNQQITFLHVFHHFVVPLSLWFAIKMVPGGHGIFFATVNSFVHSVMYLYYGLAAVWSEAPHLRARYLWWKVWLTRMQIFQFVAICLHSIQLFVDNSCRYPIIFTYLLNLYSAVFLFLFVDFYWKAYLKRKDAAAAKDSTTTTDSKMKKTMNWTGVAVSRSLKSQ